MSVMLMISEMLTGTAAAQESSLPGVTVNGQQINARQDAANAATGKRVAEAEALIKAGRAAEAYNLLEPLEFERAGDKHFDYLLGQVSRIMGNCAA